MLIINKIQPTKQNYKYFKYNKLKQVQLFQKAQEYAKEVGIQELKAKQYANILNETTKRAQNTRFMMFQVIIIFN